MAPHTAIAWLLLTVGTLCCRPAYGFMPAFFVRSPSAKLFRRMFFFAIAVPVTLAWITSEAESWRFYYKGFGSSLFTLLIIGFLVMVVWRSYRTNSKYEKELNDALLSRDEFFSVASHELKTPLTGLKLSMQIKKMPEEASLVDHVVQSINEMLDLSRIRSGKLNFNFQDTDVSALVRKTVEAFFPQITAAKCTLDLQIQDGVKLKCDGRRIEQVLLNLLGNALKHAPGCHVKVTLSADTSKVILEVQDSGPGISIEKQTEIFERFAQLGDGRKTGGLGLGLFISKNIIDGHGGTIRVKSEPGSGAAFIVELPKAS